jgi:CheY-like chemotaxis protein
MPASIERLMRVLLLNLSVDTLQAANSSLASQGYDVATHRGLAVAQVLELSPEVLVTEATPSDLSCCGLITQLKARPETESSLKIVMIVQGGAMERARALDLGADDVISFPFETVEFAARIRAQFRERKPQEELKTLLKYAVQREHFADIALQLLSGPLGKRRFWLIPAIFLLCTARHFQPRHAQGDASIASGYWASEQRSGAARRALTPRGGHARAARSAVAFCISHT